MAGSVGDYFAAGAMLDDLGVPRTVENVSRAVRFMRSANQYERKWLMRELHETHGVALEHMEGKPLIFLLELESRIRGK